MDALTVTSTLLCIKYPSKGLIATQTIPLLSHNCNTRTPPQPPQHNPIFNSHDPNTHNMSSSSSRGSSRERAMAEYAKQTAANITGTYISNIWYTACKLWMLIVAPGAQIMTFAVWVMVLIQNMQAYNFTIGRRRLWPGLMADRYLGSNQLRYGGAVTEGYVSE